LLNSGYKRAEDVVLLTKEQLLALDGVGSKSADKILEKIEVVKSIVNSSLKIT
jgi:DNA-directed RNA polymerase alpha subunit